VSKVKSAFETINEPSIWTTDKELKRKQQAIKAATTELRNRGLRVRHDFTVYSKAKASNGSN
jgi:hypothetical protein